MQKIFQKNTLLIILAMILVLTGCKQSAVGNENANENEKDSSNEQQVDTNYPEKDINGVIQWGEGSTTDIMARSISPLVEIPLGKSVILTNRSGASGAVGAQYVYDQKSDGYNLLFGAEPMGLLQVLGVSDRDFSDFYPIMLFGGGIQVVTVPADSPFETIEDLLDYAEENPGKIDLATTGPGGGTHIVSTIIEAERNIEFNAIPFDGEGQAITAILGGNADMGINSVMAAKEYQKAGELRMLAVFNDQELESLPGVPALGEIDSSFNKYFPWSSFFGVFVNKDTPDNIKAKLVDSFSEAYESEEFQKQIENLGAIPLGLSGEEAMKYMQHWQSVTTWVLHEAGETVVSPEELGIPKIEE